MDIYKMSKTGLDPPTLVQKKNKLLQYKSDPESDMNKTTYVFFLIFKYLLAPAACLNVGINRFLQS